MTLLNKLPDEPESNSLAGALAFSNPEILTESHYSNHYRLLAENKAYSLIPNETIPRWTAKKVPYEPGEPKNTGLVFGSLILGLVAFRIYNKIKRTL